MRRSAQNCGNCSAFVVRREDGQKTCRANPPTAMQVQIHNPRAALDPRAAPVIPGLTQIWPPTDENQWCRAWAPVEKVLQ